MKELSKLIVVQSKFRQFQALIVDGKKENLNLLVLAKLNLIGLNFFVDGA